MSADAVGNDTPENTTPAWTYQFIPATSETPLPTLLILYGSDTGKEPKGLIWMGQKLLPGAALLLARGKVLDGHFGRKLTSDEFSLKDLQDHTQKLSDSLSAAAAQYRLDEKRFIVFGCMSMVTFAVTTLFLKPGMLAGVVFAHPWPPLEVKELPLSNLGGIPIFISLGLHDETTSLKDVHELATLLDEAGAEVYVNQHYGSMLPTEAEFEAGRKWILENLPKFETKTHNSKPTPNPLKP